MTYCKHTSIRRGVGLFLSCLETRVFGNPSSTVTNVERSDAGVGKAALPCLCAFRKEEIDVAVDALEVAIGLIRTGPAGLVESAGWPG